ncbi:hypothetical protein DFH07DRAFT_758894, partial [Mycena maculata]
MSHFAQLRQHLLELESSFARHTERLRFIQQRRDMVNQMLDSVIYPVLTLPPEIISEIFLHLLAMAPDDEPHPSHAPLLVMNVCKQWRHIAIATPQLW